MSRNHQTKRKKFDSRQLFILSVVVFLGVGIVLSTVAYSVFRNLGLQVEGPEVISTPVFDEAGNLIISGESGNQFTDTGTRPIAPGAPPPAWDGTKRVTMLVMGIDFRDPVDN